MGSSSNCARAAIDTAAKAFPDPGLKYHSRCRACPYDRLGAWECRTTGGLAFAAASDAGFPCIRQNQELIRQRLADLAGRCRPLDLTKPVAKQEMGEGPPDILRRARGIVLRKVVDGNAGGLACRPVAKKLIPQCPGVIFQVIEHIDRAILAVLDEAQPGIGGVRQNGQARTSRQIGGPHLRVPRHRNRKTAPQSPRAGRSRCGTRGEDRCRTALPAADAWARLRK